MAGKVDTSDGTRAALWHEAEYYRDNRPRARGPRRADTLAGWSLQLEERSELDLLAFMSCDACGKPMANAAVMCGTVAVVPIHCCKRAD